MYRIDISRMCFSDIETIFNKIRDNSFFKFTGADEIQNDFVKGGKFRLIFHKRGEIFGSFLEVSAETILIDWNVNGFQRDDEINTLVKISIQKLGHNHVLNLSHENILSDDSAKVKFSSWNEVLDNFIVILEN